MGIRNRTSIGTLRDQRKRAESVPAKAEAVKAKPQAVRARSLALGPDVDSSIPSDKSDNLIERLRTVLRSENSRLDDSSSDFELIQDELSRISQHHKQARAEDIKDLVDLEPSRRHIEIGSMPFRIMLINGGKASAGADHASPNDFPTIPKLDRAPSSLDMYAQDIQADPTPKFVPLTLLISETEELKAAPVSTDPSQEAAQLTQSSMTSVNPAKKGETLPRNLVLSLLGDK